MLKQIFAVFLAVVTIVIMSCDEAGTGPTEKLDTPVITVTPDTSKIVVTWGAVDGATSYTLYRDTTAGVTDQSTADPNITGTSFTHLSLKNGVTYYYRVAAKGAGGLSSDLSEEKSGMPISAVIEPPEKFTATGWDSKIILSWDKSDGASTYTIYWDTTAGVTDTSTVIDDIIPQGYEHIGLTNGKTYYYKIAAKDLAGTSSDLSSEVKATPESGVEIPQNLTATPGDGFVLLNIDKYTGGKASFRIYWDTTAGVTTSSDTIVDQSGKGITFPYTQTDVTNGITYYYTAMAIVNGVESDLSNEASATPSDTIPLGVPQDVKATKGNAQVTLYWGAVLGATSYTIFWATDSNVTNLSDSIPVTGKNGYLHDSLINFTTYYYRVKAVDAGGTASALSDEVSATPDTLVGEFVPKNVQAVAGAGQVTISWDEVTGVDGYGIMWDIVPLDQSTKPNYMKDPTNPHIHTGLTAGTTHYYVVYSFIDKDPYYADEVSAKPTK